MRLYHIILIMRVDAHTFVFTFKELLLFETMQVFLFKHINCLLLFCLCDIIKVKNLEQKNSCAYYFHLLSLLFGFQHLFVTRLESSFLNFSNVENVFEAESHAAAKAVALLFKQLRKCQKKNFKEKMAMIEVSRIQDSVTYVDKPTGVI